MVTPIWIGSPHFYDQVGVPKLFITLHWMVGNLLGTDRAFNGTRKASSTYGVEGSVIHQYVEERDYPFSDGNTYANQHTISIEHAGGWLLPDGTRFKPTPETHETSAQLCADIARRWKLGKLVVGVNIFPHSHWVATACPGSLDIGWIANRANEINGNPSSPTTAAAAQGTGGEYALGIPDATGIQRFLKAHWGYTGLIDNDFGAGSWAAFARFLRAVWGYVGNDIPGPIMWAGIARWVRADWGYVGNDVPGPIMRAALQRASDADGVKPVVPAPPVVEPEPPVTDPVPPVVDPEPPAEDPATPEDPPVEEPTDPVVEDPAPPAKSTVSRTGALIVSGFIAVIATVGTILASCGGPS